MKILLVGNYPLDGQESMRRYTEMLSDGLRQQGEEVCVIAPVPILGGISSRSVFLRKWLGYVDKFLLFPPRLKRMARLYDVVHICDHSNALYVRAAGKRPHVITCHDLLAVRSARGHFPENPVSLTGRLLQRMIAGGLQRAGCIVCVSEKTESDLHRVLAIPLERTRVIPLPPGAAFRPMEVAEREAGLREMGISPGRRIFLHVGANHWYKNRFATLPLFKELRRYSPYRDALLVMVGQPWPAEFHRYLASHELAGQVMALTEVSDRQLGILYSAAEALLFPSREEGFGWPILEAQACGCPVVIADRAPMNRTAGEGGIWIDLSDPVGAAAVAAKALENREGWREAGFRNIERFSGSAVTKAYVATYRGVSTNVTAEYA